ncbi:MAG: YfiR family protein [Acidobacteriaceae bacterium]
MKRELPGNQGRRGEAGRRSAVVLGLTGVLVCALTLAGTMGREARAQRPSQDDVEAAYLYNFGKFVRWPASGGQGPLEICIAGPETFEKTVSRLAAGEQINQRPLAVRMVERPEGAAGCSILFVGAMDRARIDGYLGAAAGKPVLTVGESPDFLDRGGMIQFVPVEEHVRFSVNLDAANRCGVGLSSELLKVAVRVTGKPESGKEGPR